MSAINPLPLDSQPHWTQYQRYTHKHISPTVIQLTADCESQAEHRVIRDWCQWVVDECRNAVTVISHDSPHGTWEPPVARITGPNPTIIVRPSPTADYEPLDWAIRFDQNAIYDHLVADYRASPRMFIRELLQNAVDATRCKIYADCRQSGKSLPVSPNEFSAATLRKYPITVRLSEESVIDAISGVSAQHASVEVSDLGIGMSRNIVRDYLLQVGQSYYRTEEFRSRYSFAPYSRYGVGFLSALAVSDHVTVDTVGSAPGGTESGVSLTLTGLRNYILTARPRREIPGTTITVRLPVGVSVGDIYDAVRQWCPMIEFPIVVVANGRSRRVEAERPADFARSVVDPVSGATLAIKPEEIKSTESPGVRGAFYLITNTVESVESWAPSFGPQGVAQPTQELLLGELPRSVVGFQGFNSGTGSRLRYPGVRIDWRSADAPAGRRFGIAGGAVRRLVDAPWDRRLRELWESRLTQHIAVCPLVKGVAGWRYLHALCDQYPDLQYWSTCSGLVPFRLGGDVGCTSIAELREKDVPVVVDSSSFGRAYLFALDKQLTDTRDEGMSLYSDGLRTVDIDGFSDTVRGWLFRGLIITHASRNRSGDGMVLFSPRDPIQLPDDAIADLTFDYGRGLGWFPNVSWAVILLPGVWHSSGQSHPTPVINVAHPLIRWLSSVVVRSQPSQEKVGKAIHAQVLAALTNIDTRLGKDVAIVRTLDRLRRRAHILGLGDIPDVANLQLIRQVQPGESL